MYEIAQAEPTETHRYFSGGQVRASVRVADAGGRVGGAEVLLRVEGGGDPPESLGQSVKSTSAPVPFSAKIGAKTLTVALLGAQRSKSPADRALVKFAKARWSSDLDVTTKAGTLRASGLVLATTKARPARMLCLRVKASAKPGQPATGTLRILGGTGPGATLRGSLSFRAVQDAKGVGQARPVTGKRRAMPKRCAALAG